jgi:hypothetical protein
MQRLGRTLSSGLTCPDTITILMGGQRLRTRAASSNPFGPPGISTSVNTMRISCRHSKMRTASCVFQASSAKTGILHHIGRRHKQYGVVFHNQNDRPGPCCDIFHACLPGTFPWSNFKQQVSEQSSGKKLFRALCTVMTNQDYVDRLRTDRPISRSYSASEMP